MLGLLNLTSLMKQSRGNAGTVLPALDGGMFM